jgi:hypothetical protein
MTGHVHTWVSDAASVPRMAGSVIDVRDDLQITG